MTTVEERLAELLAGGEEVVSATVIRTDGAPPSRQGAKLLLRRSSPVVGTLGCSEFDAAALADAPAALEDGTPMLRTYAHELGTIEVYLEPYPQPPTLVVGSATPVAAGVLEAARAVGFRTILVETRAERLKEGRWSADTVLTRLDGLEEPLERGGALYAVLTDHDAPDVVNLCAALLPRHPRFLGLVGSRRHTAPHRGALRARGFSDTELAVIRTPVGLDLGGRTAPEISLSIVAGLVAARRGGSAGWLDAPRPG
ncbi:MAG TPA: XdhC/CoxI family protein [Candidatus Binatia bacterium]|nr:XdhC/CoxI family protein [Candidatus Binatia bacterium]